MFSSSHQSPTSGCSPAFPLGSLDAVFFTALKSSTRRIATDILAAFPLIFLPYAAGVSLRPGNWLKKQLTYLDDWIWPGRVRDLSALKTGYVIRFRHLSRFVPFPAGCPRRDFSRDHLTENYSSHNVRTLKRFLTPLNPKSFLNYSQHPVWISTLHFVKRPDIQQFLWLSSP